MFSDLVLHLFFVSFRQVFRIIMLFPVFWHTSLRASTSAASSVNPVSISISSSSFSAFSGRTISKSFLGIGRDISPCLSCCRLSLCCVREEICMFNLILIPYIHQWCAELKFSDFCEEFPYQVFWIGRVSQLLLTVNIQFVSQWRAAWSQTWSHSPTWRYPSTSLRGHALLPLTLSRGSVQDSNNFIF